MGINLCYEIYFLEYFVSINSSKSLQSLNVIHSMDESTVSTDPDLRSAIEMMALSAGLTCQQKSAVSQMKPAKEIAAAVRVPSLLPGCFSQTIFL